MTNPLDLSVVVICCDDFNVFRAVESVDPGCRVVVSLVRNQDIEAGLREKNIEYVISPRGSYSKSCNNGIAAVRTSKIFIIDSDCEIESGCLERINSALDIKPVARARVNFVHDPKMFAGRLTALFHDYQNNRLPIKAYTPGLGIRKDIIERIGGYYFDERIFWACDSEFSHRVMESGLEVDYDLQARISHGPISFTHLIHSAYKHGLGTSVQVKLGLRQKYESISNVLRQLYLCFCPDENRSPGLTGINILTFLWRSSFYTGYYYGMMQRADRVGKSMANNDKL